MTFVLDAVNSEYEECLGATKENVLVPSTPPDLERFPPDLSRSGLRFHYLVLQLKEKGWTQAKIASAISVHQTLISDWQRADFGGRKGIGADIIERCMSGPLRLHPDYFFSDYNALPAGRRDFVETEAGPRPVRPGEADALLFPIDLDRERAQRKTRELENAVKSLQARDAEKDRQMAALTEQVAALVAELRGNKTKAGAR